MMLRNAIALPDGELWHSHQLTYSFAGPYHLILEYGAHLHGAIPYILVIITLPIVFVLVLRRTNTCDAREAELDGVRSSRIRTWGAPEDARTAQDT